MSNKIYLPYSFDSYYLLNGKVYDSNTNEEIKTRRDSKTGLVSIKLNWFDRTREDYPLSLVCLITYNLAPENTKLWSKIEVTYKDENKDNLSKENIEYKFINDLEPCEENKGYFLIPGFSNYAINSVGELYSIKSRKTLNWIINGGTDSPMHECYYYCRALRDSGESRILLAHRAMALAFISTNKSFSTLQVNHINGIKHDNSLDNLEWSNNSLNVRHAIETGLTNNNKQLKVKKLFEEEEIHFNTVREAAEFLGLGDQSYLTWRLNNKPFVLVDDMYLVKYSDDPTPWREVNELNIDKCESNSVVAKNIFTKKAYIFKNKATASKLLDIPENVIGNRLKTNADLPARGYVFRHMSSDIKWPTFTKEQLGVYKRHPKAPPKAILVINTETKEREVFDNSSIFAGHFDLNVKSIPNAIKTYSPVSGKLFRGKYTLEYIT